ncbi:hypothetical protein CDAR_3221 [Caerostris darwini]|uniref:Uncharacterized protein n=1 Tax=Caerostris darwini TaxID=1538125 RepID=A0AAV4SZB2_9ARAC|nr:hypothetical protein CDAR_3221 [Caerostris darwini]
MTVGHRADNAAPLKRKHLLSRNLPALCGSCGNEEEVWGRCIDRKQCYNRVVNFLSNSFEVEDTPLPGMPVEVDEGKIKALSHTNRRIRNWIAERVN